MYNRESEIDMESVASFLKDAVSRVKTQENPDLLNDLKKVYKKNVPLSLRMYVAAYLVKESQRNFRGGWRAQRHDYKSGGARERYTRISEPGQSAFRSKPEERVPRPHAQIDQATAKTIFISIGRNRRVYPRDLVGLLVSAAGIDRDRIGDIRILANYSFVQLFPEDAEKAIEILNGYDYRGRKLAVSYSRQKDTAAEAEYDAPAEQEAQGSQNAAPETQASAEDAAAYAAAEKAAANQEPFAAPRITPAEEPDEKPSENGGYLV